MRAERSFRLVSRFAISSLLAFVAVGGILSVVVSRQLRDRQEGAAQFHVQFIAQSVLPYTFRPDDLVAPLPVTGARYQELLAMVKTRVLQRPVVRVKIWASDGTVLFSDEPRLVGRRFEIDTDLKESFAGETASEVSDLKDSENVFERGLAPKLYATYTP